MTDNPKDDTVYDNLMEMVHRHGEESGEANEIEDLRALCSAFWDLLTPEQFKAFMASEAVAFLRDNFSDDECEHPNSVGSDDKPPATQYCPDCGRNFITDGKEEGCG